MKKSINNLLIKSYMKKKDFLIYIITICILSFLIINFLNTALYIGGEYLKKIAKESYGEYHYSIGYLDKETANKIKNDKTLYKVAQTQENFTEDEYLIACDNEFTEITDCKLVKGKFPESSNEVLCNINYLFQLGYEYKEMIGAKITVDENDYIVTGLVEMQSLIDSEYNGRLVVFNMNYIELPYEYNVFIQSFSDNFKGNKESLIKKYNLNRKTIFNNGNVLNISERDECNRPTALLKIGYIILFLITGSLLVLINSVFILALGRTAEMNELYLRIGINKKKIVYSLIECVIVCYGIAILVSILFIILVKGKCSFSDFNGYLKINLLIQLVFIIIGLITNISLILKKIYKDFILFNKKSRRKSIKTGSQLVKNRDLYIQLAKNIHLFNWKSMFILILPICISGIIFISVLFYINTKRVNFANYNNYEYQITYSGNEVATKEIEIYIDTIKRIEDVVKNTNNSEILPLYIKNSQKSYIEKNTISNQYLNILENYDTQFKRQMSKSDNRYCTLRILVIGIEDKYCESIGIKKEDLNNLNENECILIGNIHSYGIGDVSSGIKKGNKIKMDIIEDNEIYNKTFTVKKIYDDLKLSIDDNNKIKIIIPKDVFVKQYEELISYSYPDIVYLNCSNNDDILNSIKGCRYITLKNIKEENQLIDSRNRIMMYIAIIISLIVALLTILNIIFVISNRFYDIKKMSNILKIIGVASRKIIKIFIIDIRRIFIIGYVIVVFLSGLICYKILEINISVINYLKYYYPFKIMGILAAIYISIFILFIYFLRRKITNGDIIRELKEENE